jgi:hypothetical protein
VICLIKKYILIQYKERPVLSRKTNQLLQNLMRDTKREKMFACELCVHYRCSTGGRWKKRARSPAQRALFPLFAPGNTMAAALYELSGEMHCRKVTHMKITQGEVGRECI